MHSQLKEKSVRKPFLPVLGLALALGTMTALSACSRAGNSLPTADEPDHTGGQDVYGEVQSNTMAARGARA
jgi:hypothetical protein